MPPLLRRDAALEFVFSARAGREQACPLDGLPARWEAFKRFQLLGEKLDVAKRPFPRFMRTVRDIANHPVTGSFLGGLMSRIVVLPPELMKDMFTVDEAKRARQMSFDEMAREALAAKEQS